MVRITDQESRKRDVLSAVIETYIKTGEAVSSEDIRKLFDCSSATIRNTMFELEENGYLTHLYTSSGRIPTDKGYRYYVDVILSQMKLLENEKTRITKEYDRQIDKLEDLLEKTSEVLSTFTHCAGIVSLNTTNKVFCKGTSFITEYPEFKNIEKVRNVLRLLEEKQRILDILNRGLQKKLGIFIGDELACKEISGCSLVVSVYDLDNKPFGRIAVLGPRSMNYGHVIPTLEYVSELMTKALESF